MKKTLQDQYLLIKEGKGHKGVFLADAKRDFPQYVPNAASFNEAVASLQTKNIISGEGGMLAINDMQFAKRAEIIWEKGTNRSSFFRGEVDKYGWVDVGSSFLPSEIIAAFLWAQLENIQDIQKRRCSIWHTYYKELKQWAEEHEIGMPIVPDFASNNAHMFYLVCKDLEQRSQLMTYLKSNNVLDFQQDH